MNNRALFSLLTLLVACGGSTDEPAMQPATTTLYQCPETSFEVLRPLVGPGINPGQGLTGDRRDGYVVHTTQIYVRPEQRDAFLATSTDVTNELDASPGMIGYSIGTDNGCGVARTLGVWESEAAMYTFVMSGAHAQAMAKFVDYAFTGRAAHWTATADEVEAVDFDVARTKVDGVEPSYVAPDAP